MGSASAPYAPDKLASHPDVLADLRSGGDGRLLSVHLMPQNLCNQRCSFCSYRLPGNKNSSAFDERVHIPWDDMVDLLDDLQSMGVLGIEVTGGGEPLAYPHTEALWEALGARSFATALVTNGTLLKDRAPLIAGSGLKWARVSIDSASEATYATMRQCPPSHFKRAWRAVQALREAAPDDPEFRLGVGFVLSNENLDEVYDFCLMARDNGADNVRLSATFSDQHLDYFADLEALKAASDASLRAQELSSDGFAVHNLIPTRLWEIQHPTQDYHRCPSKDLLCVVEGQCRVYTCCTFTGSLSGLYGAFNDHPEGFRGLWESKAEWRRRLDPRSYCQVTCLYRDRNLAMIDLIETPEHIHREFI